MRGAMRGVVGWDMWRVECKWVEAMEPVVFGGPWCGNTQHFMLLVNSFALTSQTEVKVRAHHALEADSKNVLFAAITDHARMLCTRLIFTCCCLKNTIQKLKYNITEVHFKNSSLATK